MLSSSLRPLYPKEIDPVSIVQEAGWASLGLSGQVRKISSPPGFNPRTVQPIATMPTEYPFLMKI